MRIAFATWQFVRVMVRLEETRKTSAARRTLHRAWKADWETIDAELERLREADFAAFSDLMMEREVIFEDEPADHALTVAEIADEVATQLASARKGASKQERADLEFEHAELAALAAELRRAVEAG